jgi:hypothetical protein
MIRRQDRQAPASNHKQMEIKVKLYRNAASPVAAAALIALASPTAEAR